MSPGPDSQAAQPKTEIEKRIDVKAEKRLRELQGKLETVKGKPMERKMLSPQTQVELAERVKAERPGYRLGDQMHGPWCELIHEENRWWEVFSSALNPASRAYLRAAEQRKLDAPLPADSTVEKCVERAAAVADAAIAAARKRGRL